MPSLIELASLSVSSVSYLLGMNTKKDVHRNRKGNHWNSNIKLKKKKLLADDVFAGIDQFHEHLMYLVLSEINQFSEHLIYLVLSPMTESCSQI